MQKGYNGERDGERKRERGEDGSGKGDWKGMQTGIGKSVIVIDENRNVKRMNVFKKMISVWSKLLFLLL